MEWKEVSDIVKITLQAISDVIRVQGETLRDLEKQIVSKVKFTLKNSATNAVNAQRQANQS